MQVGNTLAVLTVTASPVKRGAITSWCCWSPLPTLTLRTASREGRYNPKLTHRPRIVNARSGFTRPENAGGRKRLNPRGSLLHRAVRAT
jgi:hypothetical protein